MRLQLEGGDLPFADEDNPSDIIDQEGQPKH